jgi:hypothetical protein
MKTARLFPIAILLAATAGPALAQDVSASPSYGTINLAAGFPNDPRNVDLQAGGTLDATRVPAGDCHGFIAGPPDLRVNYQAGSGPLTFSVSSDVDTTLVISGPDDHWSCNDDSNGLNPRIRFDHPDSGQYDIWVGTMDNGTLHAARLSVSELGSPSQ